MSDLNNLINKKMKSNLNSNKDEQTHRAKEKMDDPMTDNAYEPEGEPSNSDEGSIDESNSEMDEDDLDAQQKEFVSREHIGKGQANLKKYQHCLETSLGVFLPKQGLGQRDLANQGLGRIEKVQKNQILFDKFQEWIGGVCDYDSLMWWLLNHHTSKYIFKRYRSVKGSNKRLEVPTKVDHKYLVSIALNLGGAEFQAHQDSAWKKKHSRKGNKMGHKMPKFLSPKPKQIIPFKNNKKNVFSESLANHMDRELLLDSNPAFKILYTNKIITSKTDYQNWIEKLKKSKLDLKGDENVLQVNALLQDKLCNGNWKEENNREKIRKMMKSDCELAKEDFIDIIIKLGIDYPIYEWIEDFGQPEFEFINKRLNKALKKIETKLQDEFERETARNVIGKQLTTQLNGRLKE